MKTFGAMIAEARKKAHLTQLQLAAQIKNEEDRGISAPYLNDIEHDHRQPPRGFLLQQFAEVLNLDPDLLYFCGRQLPFDIDWDKVPPELEIVGFCALRRTLTTRFGIASGVHGL
ncbi:MAG TPA: helix-turn-helix transcriptional regulator [Candidatus Binataceae bacterium]|nr:helix-turn-helix transcriptional regulator [Candidatus Binataceae bacterium]